MSYAARYRRKKSNTAAAVLVISGLFVFGGLVIGFVALLVRSQRDAPPVVQEPPPQTIAADRVFAHYDANEVAGDQYFKGRTWDVVGVVRSVGKDIADTPYVTLESKSPLFAVQMMFADSQQADLAQIRVGDDVTIRGRGAGKLLNVVFRECRVIRVYRPGS